MSKNIFTGFIASGLKIYAKTRLPRIDGEIHLPGLKQAVEILRDPWGVPHIYAEHEEDLFFAQGYVHAQDRFWQMEFNRRLVAGRLSEILGSITVPLDRWMRVLTMRRVAEFESEIQDSNCCSNLEAYANGINAFLETGKLPTEIALLRYRPEPWVVADTLSWVKMMAWSLSVNWEAELLRAQLIARLGPETASELEPSHLARWPLVIPPGVDYDQIDISVLERVHQLRPFAGPSPYEGLGSNNWVISGELSSTGKPLLANDMHLALTAPSIWYENHLITEAYSLSGVTFPGIPGIVAGHNGNVAWSFTNGFPDVQDLYIERLRTSSNGEMEAEYKGKWEKTKTIDEEIKIKDQASVIQKVIITRHGPIINDLAPGFCGDNSLALRWTALDPDRMIRCTFEMMKVKNCEEFNNILRHWTTPPQNVVYADSEGNIGYTLAGKIPVRKKGNGRVPVPGWTDEYEWNSYLPFEVLPHLENPSQGYIVSANNRVADTSYPVRLELEPISGDRAQRIAEMILDTKLRHDQEKINVDQYKHMQLDLCSPTARVIARILGTLKVPNSALHQETELQNVLKILRDWDGILSADSNTALIYEKFIRQIIRMMIKDKLDPTTLYRHSHQSNRDENKQNGAGEADLTSFFLGKGPTPVLADHSLFGERWLPWLTEQMADPLSKWFDLGKGESRDECMLKALELTIAKLKTEYGSEMKLWSWGKKHQLTFNHPLGANTLLSSTFNVGPFPIGGDQTTVWASTSDYHDLDSSQMIGPSYRMIIDLSDPGNSISVLAPGQSGNPASPHYRDQVKDWFTGGYHSMLFERAVIESMAKHRLKLLPS
jgi:penicillin amidase